MIQVVFLFHERTPNARIRVLMGPTVPLRPVFYQYRIHVVDASLISDAPKLLAYCQHDGGGVAKVPPQSINRVNVTCEPEWMDSWLRYTN